MSSAISRGGAAGRLGQRHGDRARQVAGVALGRAARAGRRAARSPATASAAAASAPRSGARRSGSLTAAQLSARRVARRDRQGAVELLGEHDPRELVGHRERPQREALLALGDEVRGEPDGAAEQEGHRPRRLHAAGQPGRRSASLEAGAAPAGSSATRWARGSRRARRRSASRARARSSPALHRLGRDLVHAQAGEPVDALLVEPPGRVVRRPQAPDGGDLEPRRPAAQVSRSPSRARRARPIRSSAVGWVPNQTWTASGGSGTPRLRSHEPLLQADRGVGVARERQAAPLGLALVGAADPGHQGRAEGADHRGRRRRDGDPPDHEGGALGAAPGRVEARCASRRSRRPAAPPGRPARRPRRRPSARGAARRGRARGRRPSSPGRAGSRAAGCRRARCGGCRRGPRRRRWRPSCGRWRR